MYDSSGKIVNEQLFLQVDTGLLANGYSKFYYENGKCSALWFYKNGLLDSVYSVYNRKGGLSALGYYKKGKRDSFGAFYYSNGKLRQKEHYLDNHISGSQYIYDSLNGHTLLFNFWHVGKDKRFSIKYNHGTSKFKTSGDAVDVIIPNEKKIYSSSDTAKINLVVAKPEDMECSLSLYMNDYTHFIGIFKTIDLEYYQSYDIHVLKYEYPCVNGGNSKFIAVYNLIVKQTKKTILRDTLSFDINVQK